MNQLLETKPADVVADFLKDKLRFADFVNLFLFNGRQKIAPSDLLVFDSDSSTVFYQNEGIASVGKRRDSIMLAKIDDIDVIIAIEHQQAIDYSMPFRVLMYDTIGYNQQYNQSDRNARRAFHPIPVITFVLYTGQRHWIQPRTLTDMMKIPESIREKINNWNLNVIDIKTIEVNEKLHCEDNQKVIGAVQQFYCWDGDISHLIGMVMSKEAAVVVATIIGEERILRMIEQEEKEEIDMCTSVTNALNKATLQGEQKGRELGLKDGLKVGKKEGLQAGIKEGLKAGKIEVITNLLKTKLGDLSDEVMNQIRACNEEQLDLLVKHYASINSEQDIFKMISG